MDKYTEEQIDLAIACGRLVEQRHQLEDTIRELVEEMRSADMSWAKVGLALGCTGQSAWERYSGVATRLGVVTPEQDPLPGLGRRKH